MTDLSVLGPKIKKQLAVIVKREVRLLLRAETDAKKQATLAHEERRRAAHERQRLLFYEGMNLGDLLRDACMFTEEKVTIFERGQPDDEDILRRNGFDVEAVQARSAAFNADLAALFQKHDGFVLRRRADT